MSFFLQGQRKTNFQVTATPSPGQYQAKSLGNSRKYAVAPFGSTQPLNRAKRAQRKKESNPQGVSKQLEEVFLVNDMNIKIKAQQQISSVFKSGTQRFHHNVAQIPGPGQYEPKNTLLNKIKSSSLISPVHQYALPLKPTVPSIPVDNLGFKEDDLNQMKKVKPPKTQLPHPGSYQISLPFNSKGVVPWKAQNPIKKDAQPLPGPGEYTYLSKGNKSMSSCFHSSTDRFGRAKKIREQKMPGPGQYNLQGGKKLSHNMSNESYFNSKTARFQKDMGNNSVGPGMYYNELNTKNKSLSVNAIRRMPLKQQTSKTVSKKSIFEVKNNNPGPGEYRTNFGISYQLHKALLKKQTGDVLPKERRTVFEPKEEEYHPGPGTYQQQQAKKNNPRGKIWKKTEVINLKGQQQPSPSPMDYPNFHNTIQSKIKQMNSKLTLTQQKPFNSGAERFKHYSNKSNKIPQHYTQDTQQQEEGVVDLMKSNSQKKVKRLVMTTIKVRVPFGISSNKYEEKVYQGPDFYQKTIDWVKPSFSIKSKIQ